MISNIGCSEQAAHSNSLKMLPRGIRRVFNMKTYEVSFPIKHPEYVIPDVDYEKKRNRIMGYNYPLVFWFRKIESLLLMLRFGKWKKAVTKFKNTFFSASET